MLLGIEKKEASKVRVRAMNKKNQVMLAAKLKKTNSRPT